MRSLAAVYLFPESSFSPDYQTLIYIYIHTHTRARAHIYTYIYVCVYIYICTARDDVTSKRQFILECVSNDVRYYSSENLGALRPDEDARGPTGCFSSREMRGKDEDGFPTSRLRD